MTRRQCPLCGDSLDKTRILRVGGWEVCAHHWVRIQPSKYASRCHECLGAILPGEEIVLSKDGKDARWVALHRRDRCDETIRVEPEAPDGPWATLYLVPGAPTEVIKAVYRALSQKYHPDRGGDVARMQEINAAMAALIK
jgi:hypothetical protein